MLGTPGCKWHQLVHRGKIKIRLAYSHWRTAYTARAESEGKNQRIQPEPEMPQATAVGMLAITVTMRREHDAGTSYAR